MKDLGDDWLSFEPEDFGEEEDILYNSIPLIEKEL